MNTRVCHNCQQESGADQDTCPHCGAPQSTLPARRGRITASLLAIFLGAFGVHRFYLGQWWGVFYLLFCWTLIPSLVGLFEGFVFMLADDKAWDIKYNGGILGGPAPTGIGCLVMIAIAISFVMQTRYAIVGYVFTEHWIFQSQMKDAEREMWKTANAVTAYYEQNGVLPADFAALNLQVPDSLVKQASVNPKTGLITLTLSIWHQKDSHYQLRPYLAVDGGFGWSCYNTDQYSLAHMTEHCHDSQNQMYADYDFSRPPLKH